MIRADITSRQNELVKQAKQLLTAKGRRTLSLHLAEGEKLVREALSHAEVERIFTLPEMAAAFSGMCRESHTVTPEVLAAICETGTPQGVAAVVRTPQGRHPDSGSFLLALDALQDPGNVGTMIRTADAMGFAGVLLGEGCADPFAPKALRASMGSAYHIPLWRGALALELERLKAGGFTLIAGHLRGAPDLPGGRPCALVIGNESAGVSDEIASLCTLYRLPMPGGAQSLNASVAAGIMMYRLSSGLL